MLAGPILVVLAFAGPSPSEYAFASHLESLGSLFLIWTASASALGAIAGIICGVVGAIKGEAMAPVGFRRVAGLILTPVRVRWTTAWQSLSAASGVPASEPAGAEHDGRSKAKDAIAKPAPPVEAIKKKASPFGRMITSAILLLLWRRFAPDWLPAWARPGTPAHRTSAPLKAGPAPNPHSAPSRIAVPRQQDERRAELLRRLGLGEKSPENAGPLRSRDGGQKLAPSIAPPSR